MYIMSREFRTVNPIQPTVPVAMAHNGQMTSKLAR